VIGGFPAWAAMQLPVCVGITQAGRYVEDGNLPCGVSA